MERMPMLAELGIKREVHGAISHPPDGNPLIGPAPGAKNYWCCCGTQIGIGWGPGLTRELARWMVHGAADISMRDLRSAAFRRYAEATGRWTKAKEDYCCATKSRSRTSTGSTVARSRPARMYERLEGQGRGLRGGLWPRAPALVRPRWRRAARPLFLPPHAGHDMVAAESAVREAAGVMDISAFTKVEVSGPDAPQPCSTGWCRTGCRRRHRRDRAHALPERRGRIELETTVVRSPRTASTWSARPSSKPG